jgi:uncharacterized phage protein (TIGR01671 family)
MREILFRGKNEYTGWIYGDLRNYEKSRAKAIFSHELLHRIEVIPETVGQYSGKDDDNGEKLFEGDIVKGLFLHSDSVLSVVTFKDGAFGLEWNRGTVKTFSVFTSICNVTYEKIGNIFDNPELLKEGETE